ncbi:hypothetical protein [Ignavibacterium sp.]|jgi:hypothetical protein|uniref:hypothetical protein n=1 Tax=Ignavibacterium sp. TaxID=2651167 RepID=UPI0025B8766F|nr:hypothetical protein [Ignavibacterium sp.]
MNNLTSAFSLYEVFRILLPGTYVCLAAFDFLNRWGLDYKIFDDSTLNTALNIIIIIIVGLFFYSFDFPRKLRKKQKILPSIRIKNKHPEIDEEKIRNSYFDFYDDLDIKYKYKHEKYSGYFHLSLNMALTSFIILLVSLVNIPLGYFSDFIYVSSLILILSVIIAINIYLIRFKSSYQRHIEKYYNSEFYKKLIDK